MITNTFTGDQWACFEEQGFVTLGRVEAGSLRKLKDRIEAIMRGEAEIDYDRLLMQKDSESGRYEDAGEQSNGFKGSSLNYRKIQNLELDPVFREYLGQPLFETVCGQVYGEETRIGLFRAMFMNKPAHRGTYLPWHQDRWTALDRDPKLTVWTAMDPATRENGCVQLIPGSHRHGLINPTHGSGFLNEAQAAAICTPDRIVHLELEEGDVVALHNYLLHASDVNRSSQSRRAFSVCYMDAATLREGRPYPFPPAFGGKPGPE